MLNAQRLYGDDTTVPVLAKGKTIIGRLWDYVRDDRPFGGPDPPAAVSDHSHRHPSLSHHGTVIMLVGAVLAVSLSSR